MEQISKDERDFHHPYEPYDIQVEFMNAVYDCIEGKKIGIFESPTGTGKSLSLACASLTWLREHKSKVFNHGLKPEEEQDRDEPDWILEHAREEKRRNALQRKSELEAKLAKVREREAKQKARYETGEPPRKKQRSATDENTLDGDDEAKFVLDDYESDGEQSKSAKSGKALSGLTVSAETQALLDKLGNHEPKAGDDLNEEVGEELKIFFCSRTHSQLNQFVNELRKIKLPPAVQEMATSEVGPQNGKANVHEELKHLTLGSRKNLCINSKVSKLGSAAAITERCLELQQPGTSQDAKCAFLPTSQNEALVNEFRDHALASIRDIEDLGVLGKRIGICPYYASRAAIQPTEIVTLPYPLLLQKSAREALNISLKDHIVIIDEAHNLMDAIANLYSVVISFKQLRECRTQLSTYLQKFRNRLKGKNRVYVTQLVRLLDSLTQYLEAQSHNDQSAEAEVSVDKLMAGKGVDQINLYKLLDYLQESKLARKVDGYIEHVEGSMDGLQSEEQGTGRKKRSTSTPVLYQLQSFLLALAYPQQEGRFFYSRTQTSESGSEDTFLKYLLLDPTYHFKSVVEDARAVILAGGTMSPMNDFTNHLFHYLPADRMQTLSCGHVIPTSNLTAFSIAKGSNNVDFDFSFAGRHNRIMKLELGKSIARFCKLIPDGVVVFFPSYSMLEDLTNLWRGSQVHNDDQNMTLFEQFESQKRVFLERRAFASSGEPNVPKSSSAAKVKSESATGGAEALLAEYASHIHSAGSKGALLFAVIGGSLSEGINFSDRLGRGIVVVGLPFPNPHSAEWKAKSEFIDRRYRDNVSKGDSPASHELYENTCMRAVNQSIGRAIRHKDDYAAIILVDRRYEKSRLRSKLPGWIRGSLRTDVDSIEEGARGLKAFFQSKS